MAHQNRFHEVNSGYLPFLLYHRRRQFDPALASARNKHSEAHPHSHIPNKDIFLETQRRQLGEPCSDATKEIISSYVTRQLPGLLKEKEYHLGQINKVFASSWVSDRQVVFGTKCNKLIVMDLVTKQMARIPSMRSSDDSEPAQCPCGIHAIAINPSKTLLATGAENTNDVAIYKLPTFDPVCVGEGGHDDWIFDIKWLDDQFLVTGSRDSRMCLWRVADEENGSSSGGHGDASSIHVTKHLQQPEYGITSPLAVKQCINAEKVRALAYNSHSQEIAALSLNACVHIWDATRFQQKSSIKLQNKRENVCMCIRPESGVYAVGSQSHITLFDPRARKKHVSIISQQGGCGIRSVNFNSDMLSIGTGAGSLYFFDYRAMKYLDLECGQALSLNVGPGWLLRDETYRDFFSFSQVYPNAIYTHCYDDSGTRLFAAGGPLPASLYGNYAGLWH